MIAKESSSAVSVRTGPRRRQRLTAGQGARDKEKREKIDLKNQVETLIYQAEKQLGELGDKVAADDKAKVEGFTADLKAAVEKDDTAAIKATLEQLQQALCRRCLRVPAGRRRWCSRRCSRRRQRQWRFRRRQLRR